VRLVPTCCSSTDSTPSGSPPSETVCTRSRFCLTVCEPKVSLLPEVPVLPLPFSIFTSIRSPWKRCEWSTLFATSGRLHLTVPLPRLHTVRGSTTLFSLSYWWLPLSTSGSSTRRRPGDRSRRSRYAYLSRNKGWES
jgi:hypothetical protein